MRYTKNLFRPEVSVAVVYVVFLTLAFASFKIANTREFLLLPRGYFSNEPSFLAYAISLLGVAVLFFSVKIGRNLAVASKPSAAGAPAVLASIFAAASLALYLTFPLPLAAIFAVSGSYAFLLWFISKRLRDVNFLVSIALVLAFFFSFLMLLGGIPVLSAASRQAAAIAPARALFHGFAVFSAALLVAFYEKRKALAVILLLALLAAISGFKSDAIAILVSASIAGLLLKRISAGELLLAVASVVFILTAMSTYIAGISYGAWKIAPHLYVFYRAGLTFSVFDAIVQLSFPFGYLHGKALLSTTQEIVSTAVLGYEEPHIITSTLLGPGMLDFGIFGVVLTCILLGIYLGIMHDLRDAMRTCLYAIALTHTFIIIEVGMQLSSIIFYLSLLYFALAVKGPKLTIVSAEPQKSTAAGSWTIGVLILFILLAGCMQVENSEIKAQPAKSLPPATSMALQPVIEPKLLWKYKTGDEVYGIGVASKAEYVVVGSWDDHVYLLDKKGELLWQFKTKGSVEDVAISENYVAATSHILGEGTLYLLSISGELLWNRTFPNHLKGVDLGQGVLVGSGDGSIYLFYSNGTKAWEYKTENSAWGVWDVAFSKGSIVAGGDDGNLYLLTTDGKLMWKKNLGRESYIYGVAISQDGEYTLAVSQDKYVHSFKNGEQLWKRSTGFSNYGVAISKYIVAGSWDGHLYLFDINGNLLWKYSIDNNVNRVAFSPEGSYLAAASSDGYAYLFEIG